MAVTAVTITSGPTVVGRRVIISGTLDRDGGGTNNNLNFKVWDSNNIAQYSITKLSDSSTVYNAAGTSGTAIAWTWTGFLPEGNYLQVTVNLNESPFTTLATSASNVGLIELRKGLSNIWIPQRDANGFFTDLPSIRPQGPYYYWNDGNASNKRKSYHYAMPYGAIYTNIWGKNAVGVDRFQSISLPQPQPTPYGIGIDVPNGWYHYGYPNTPGGHSVASEFFVSLVYVYDAQKYLSSTSCGFGVGVHPSNPYINWSNLNGEQTLTFTNAIYNFAPEIYNGTVGGIGNGLHCLLVKRVASTVANGHKVFLNGQLVLQGTYTGTYMSAGTIVPFNFGGSLSKSGQNIATTLFHGIVHNDYPSDEMCQRISSNPYRYFFQDAVTNKDRIAKYFYVKSPPKIRVAASLNKPLIKTLQQPQGTLTINRKNPLTQGLIRMIAVNGSGVYAPLQFTNTTTPISTGQFSGNGAQVVANPSGIGLNGFLANNTNTVTNSGYDSGFKKATIFAYGWNRDLVVGPYGVDCHFIHWGSAFTVYKGGYEMTRTQAFATFTTSDFQYPGGALPAGTIVKNTPFAYVAVLNIDNGYAKFYYNGKLIETWTGALTGVARLAGNMYMGQGQTGTDMQIGAVWNRELTQTEVLELSRNPWQMFTQKRQLYAIPGTSTDGKFSFLFR